MRHKNWTVCIVTLIMILGMGGGTVSAAGVPSLNVAFNASGKSAVVTVRNISGGVFGVQAQLEILPEDGQFTVTPSKSSYYCEMKQKNGESILYVDSKDLMGSSGDIALCTISSSTAFSVGGTADLILMDSNLKGENYGGVVVTVTKASSGSSDEEIPPDVDDDTKDDNEDDSKNDSKDDNEDKNEPDDTDKNNNHSSGESSSSSTSSVVKPTVSGNSHGSVKISSNGKKITITPDKGYKVKDVIVDGKSVGAVTEYTFSKVNKNSKVQVIYELIEDSKETVPEKDGTVDISNNNVAVVPTDFQDVPTGFWASDSIKFVVSNGLFFGTDESNFSPGMNMTRGMFVTVLYRFDNALGTKWHVDSPNQVAFTDVPASTWYTQSVAWAGGSGLVSGTGDGTFSPDMPITREQIAVMIMNFAKKCDVDLEKPEQPIVFEDWEDISPWAQDAVSKAQQAGILYGREGNRLDPKATATRAEVASMLERFVKNTGGV